MTAFINRFIPDAQSIDASQWLEQQIAIEAAEDMAGRKFTAIQCADFCRLFLADAVNGREGIAPFVHAQGLDMPVSSIGWMPERLRLESVEWWARQLKKRDMRQAEYDRIGRGQVQKYCSDELLDESEKNQQRLADWLKRSTLENQNGESLNLMAVAAKTVSNPRVRVSELAVRTKGMAAYYSMLGWRGLLMTVTASSSWHKNSKTYNGASPKDTQLMLNQRYALVRTWLANHGVRMAGVRVAEPHKDATVHWHLSVWFENGQMAKKAVQAFRKYFLFYEGPPEPGAAKNRLDFKTVNPAKGDVVGYVLKYITKGITGEHIDEHTDKNGEPIAPGLEGAARVRAWARCWGIRQYQFIGLPPVNVYRELRRVRGQSVTPAAELGDVLYTVPTEKEMNTGTVIPMSMMSLWIAANEGDYFAYINAYNDEPVKPKLLKHRFVDDLALLAEHYGDIQSVPERVISTLESLSKYQEPKAMVYGIALGDEQITTRQFGGYFEKFWTIKTAASEETPAEPEAYLETYASVRGADGFDDDYWGDVVAFAAHSGVFGKAGGRAASDLWQ